MVEVLTHDHREVEGMFARLEAPGITAEQRHDLVEQVTIELVRHSVAEEQWLYPAVRRHVADGDKIADEEIAEHAEVEQALKDLEGMAADDPAYSAKISTLIADVRHHVNEEEHELFPKLIAVSSDEDLRELGAKIEKAKKIAPTRPHPSSPSTPPANMILAPGVGLIDRLRDALTGRG
ncbi:MAG: hemerythrin domain-containing protein [Actinocatenispora sp.]